MFFASSRGVASRPGWVVSEDSRFLECLCRHQLRLLRGDGGRRGNPWDRDIEFRARVVSLHGYAGRLPHPILVVQGPMKQVTVGIGNVRDEGLAWEYPWTNMPEEDEPDDSQRIRWFFPDALPCPSVLMMLAIARWWRSWDQRWYIAGLTLVPAGGGLYLTPKDKEPIKVPFMRWVGYFEHAWVTQHEH